MALTILVNGVDITSSVRRESLTLVESAYRGEVGMGGFIVDDPSASITIPAMKDVLIDESLDSPTRVYTGFTNQRMIQRGRARVANARQWDVELYDRNVLIDDFLISGAEGGDRPQETDTARIAWLVASTAFGGELSGAHISGTAVTMDASDYRGRTPREVLEDCAEKSHKNFFIYRHSSTQLYYDKHTNTTLSSSLRLSTVQSDVDNTTTFGAIVEAQGMRLNPERVYSTVRFQYKRGSIWKTDAGTLAAYRERHKSLINTRAKTATRADELADKYLEAADSEQTTFSMSVILPAAQVNEIRAGHRIEVKAPYMGISSFTFKRITRRIVSPVLGQGGSATDTHYHLRLDFWDDVRPTRYVTQPEDFEERSNSTDDDATVIIDRSGITVTDGAITVINGSDVVIIDGSSDIIGIIASGTLSLPQNTSRGDVTRNGWVNTGVSTDPLTIWSSVSPGASSIDWATPLPQINMNDSGEMINAIWGRAKWEERAVDSVMRDGTLCQAVKFTSVPPYAGQLVRFRITNRIAL